MNTLCKRTLSGIVYLVVLVSCVLYSKYSFLAVMLLFCGVMLHEFMKMTMGNEYRMSQTLTIITGISYFSFVWAVRAFPQITAEFVFLSIVPLMAVMINSLYVKDKGDFGKFANVYTALFYIAIPMSINIFLVMDKFGEYNGWLLICFFIIVWCSDIGAYLLGITLGQKYGRKLFPSISPKKSWIGFWGGLALAIAASAIMYFTGLWEYAGLEDFTLVHAIVLGALMNVAGVYGDLFESQWKRHYEVKDSGSIIPGHGGLLDRLDSTIFAVPIGVLYLSLFKYITTI